jgi:catechol 2,3-dioxygenase-like lactoylglutathione lyase family enzyme
MPNATTPIVVTLWLPDPDASLPFYTETLRLTREDHHGQTPNLSVGHMSLVLMSGQPQPVQDTSRKYWPIFAWSSNEYAAIKADLQAQDVAILEESPAGQPHEWFMFADPAGNILELVNAAGPSS